tara:strand:- start:1495 stop:1716 length:222 start_codon:yes stop_codon:yes gene_type:complete
MNIGKTFIFIGILFFSIGVILIYFKDSFNWFGNLIGDISFKKGNFSFFMPITSMLIISFLLSIIVNVISKFFK